MAIGHRAIDSSQRRKLVPSSLNLDRVLVVFGNNMPGKKIVYYSKFLCSDYQQVLLTLGAEWRRRNAPWY